jgi:hypothetical protein
VGFICSDLTLSLSCLFFLLKKGHRINGRIKYHPPLASERAQSDSKPAAARTTGLRVSIVPSLESIADDGEEKASRRQRRRMDDGSGDSSPPPIHSKFIYLHRSSTSPAGSNAGLPVPMPMNYLTPSVSSEVDHDWPSRSSESDEDVLREAVG